MRRSLPPCRGRQTICIHPHTSSYMGMQGCNTSHFGSCYTVQQQCQILVIMACYNHQYNTTCKGTLLSSNALFTVKSWCAVMMAPEPSHDGAERHTSVSKFIRKRQQYSHLTGQFRCNQAQFSTHIKGNYFSSALG